MKKRLLICALVMLCSNVSFAADGKAVGVDPDAAAIFAGVSRTLQVGADVYVGELVETGPQGQVQMVFSDNTHLVVGARSSLLIEKYLLAGDGTAQSFGINALSGTFRFVTGNSPKPSYSIRTPSATIAIRGTKFDLVVGEQQTHVMLYEGALEICSTNGTCVVLDERCELGAASSLRAQSYSLGTGERLQQSYGFRYARFQQALLQEFRIDGAVHCAEPGPVTLALGDDGSGGEAEADQPFDVPQIVEPDEPTLAVPNPDPAPTPELELEPQPEPIPIPTPDPPAPAPQPAPTPAPRPIP